MSKSIRKILGEAYSFVGLSPNGVLVGNQTTNGLQFANEIIQQCNENCLFPFTFQTLVGRIEGGDAKISPTSDNFRGDVPASISAVFYKNGDNDFIELRKCEYKDIFNVRNSSSNPSWYAFVQTSENEVTLYVDGTGSAEIMVIYPKVLPEMGIDDTFIAPKIYEQALKYGVASMAAAQAGLENDSGAGKLYNNVLHIIKDSNGAKRPLKRIGYNSYSRHELFNCPRVRF